MQQPEFNPYQPPRSVLGETDEYRLWLRVVIALLCVLSSGGGLLISIPMIAMPLVLIGQHGFGLSLLISPIMLFAWIAFFRMLWGWLRNCGVSDFWYFWGTVAGVISALAATVGSILVLPAILLACYLVYFHSRLNRLVAKA